MLLRSLEHRDGHCSGSRYTVPNATDHLLLQQLLALKLLVPGDTDRLAILTASKLCGVDAGRVILILRISLQHFDADLPFFLKRQQFLARSAFVISTNKSRRQSSKRYGLHLPTLDECEEIWTDSTTFKTAQVMLRDVRLGQIRFDEV